MRFHKFSTGNIARERLYTMIENSSLECTPEQMTQMKKEISEIVRRYVHKDPEEYSIRVQIREKSRTFAR